MACYSATRYGMTTPYEILPLGATTPVRDAVRATADEAGGPVGVAAGALAGVVAARGTAGRLVARVQNPLAAAAEALSEGAMPVSAGDIIGT